MQLDAANIPYRQLNENVRELVEKGETDFELTNVNGHRYIGAGLKKGVRLDVFGVPGNDLAAFVDGATVHIHNDAQDGVGNTMNGGLVVVEGDCGDVLGYGMRGGEVYVKGDVGYRVGIHMKSDKHRSPVVVAGGRAGAVVSMQQRALYCRQPLVQRSVPATPPASLFPLPKN